MRKTFRAVVKGLTWRLFAAFDTFLVTTVVMFWKTGTFGGSAVFTVVAGIVGMELLTKTFLYTLHEKFWELPTLTKLFS